MRKGNNEMKDDEIKEITPEELLNEIKENEKIIQDEEFEIKEDK